MLSLDMTAPSITTAHVIGRGMSIINSKSDRHGRIYNGLFHSSTSSSPSSPSFQCSPMTLCSHWCLFSFTLPLSLSCPHLQIFFSAWKYPVFLQWNKELHLNCSLILLSIPLSSQWRCLPIKIYGPCFITVALFLSSLLTKHHSCC